MKSVRQRKNIKQLLSRTFTCCRNNLWIFVFLVRVTDKPKIGIIPSMSRLTAAARMSHKHVLHIVTETRLIGSTNTSYCTKADILSLEKYLHLCIKCPNHILKQSGKQFVISYEVILIVQKKKRKLNNTAVMSSKKTSTKETAG